jgi:hypothetical protein
MANGILDNDCINPSTGDEPPPSCSKNATPNLLLSRKVMCTSP